jgi:hypothetical protein
MGFFKPFSTLAVGIVLGLYVVPKVARAVNIPLPGA